MTNKLSLIQGYIGDLVNHNYTNSSFPCKWTHISVSFACIG